MGIGISFGGSDSKQKSSKNTVQDVTGTNTTGQSTTGSGLTQGSYWDPNQQKLASLLSGSLSGSLNTGQQAQTQSLINSFMGGGAAQDALTRAATGTGYSNIIDPKATEALYAAIQKQTMEDILPKTTQAIAKNANLAGMLNSGPALKMQLENQGQIVNSLANTLAQLRYQDEQARRGIEQEREARQVPAAQALQGLNQAQIAAGMQDPRQASINNILSMLGIRGTTTEKTQQAQDTSGWEEMTRNLKEWIDAKGKGSSDSSGFSLGLG